MRIDEFRDHARAWTGRQVTRPVASAFHAIWYDNKLWTDVTWQGIRVEKNPFDLWCYQEIIHETKPELIIETGTHSGGSALFFSHLLDLQGNGHVVTVDVSAQPGCPEHPRLTYLAGSSTAPEVVNELARRASEAQRVMVVLDSDHTNDHVLDELRLLSPLVTVGCYCVVEDTNINGHPVHRRFGPGPMEALSDFLASTDEFQIDQRRERFLMTFNPSGWLRRVR